MAKQQLPSWVPETFTASVMKTAYAVEGIHDLPETALAYIFAYGLQQISNDAGSAAKDAEGKRALADKKWAALRAGTIRMAAVRSGDPVKRRALEIATDKVRKSAKFAEWLVKAGLKVSDKRAVEAVRANAEKLIAGEDNPIMAQAKRDVEAAQSLDVDIELDL